MKVLISSTLLLLCGRQEKGDAYSISTKSPRRVPSSLFHRQRRQVSLVDDAPAMGSTGMRPSGTSWKQRIVIPGGFFRRQRKDQKTLLKVATLETQESEVDLMFADVTSDFIRENFRQLNPSTPVDAMLSDVSRSSSTLIVLKHKENKQADLSLELQSKVSPLTRLTRGWLENILTGLFHRWSNGNHQGMDVSCNLKSSLRETILRGRLVCDARVVLDRICFNAIRLSGGSIEAQRLALNIWSFSPLSRRRLPRFPSRFDLVGHNVTFSQEDLIQSPCIRNGLRRLLTRILHGRGMNTMFVKIDDLHVLQSGKLSVKATATTILGQRVPFELRTALDTQSRGHILVFTGLELSFMGGIAVPIVPEISLDLGHNAQILHIKMEDESIQLSVRVTITPEHTIHVPKYRQSSRSYAANCSVDVGRWLTRLGRFSC